MALVATTVRWEETAYEYIREEARAAGVTVSQFVRESALERAAVRQARREAPGLPLDFMRLADEVERRAAVKGRNET